MRTYPKLIVPVIVTVCAIVALIVADRSWRHEVGETKFTYAAEQGVRKPGAEVRTRVGGTINESSSVPIFTGYLTLGSDKWFALALPGAGEGIEGASWRRIGEKIGEFELVRFDGDREVIVFKKANEQAIEVRLVDGTLVSSNAQFRRILERLIDTSPRKIRDIPSQKAIR